MAGKKNSRTSKTDHVLSLLSGGSVEAQPEAKERRKQPVKDAPANEDSSREKAPVQAEHRAAPPILEVARVHNEALSEAIREALNDTLEQELAQEAAQASDAPVEAESALGSDVPEEKTAEDTPVETQAETESSGQSEAQEMPAPQSEAAKPVSTVQDAPASVSSGEDAPAALEPEPAPAASESEAIGAAETASEQVPETGASTGKPAESASQAQAAMEAAPEKEMPAAAPEAQAEQSQQPKGGKNTPGETTPLWPAARTPLSDGSVYIDVMAELVDEPIEKYVRLFGLCSCRRCLADVRALTLSRLTPKYVVLPGPSVTPMMSFFQAKFESAVIAQVINACKTVMESPRHTL